MIGKNTPPHNSGLKTDRKSAAAHYDITMARSDSLCGVGACFCYVTTFMADTIKLITYVG